MRLLLDTHVIIWALEDDPRLSQSARALILNEANLLYYSDASVWEVALKHLSHPEGIVDGRKFDDLCQSIGARRVPIKKDHILHASDFPTVHYDPFDRLLMAQAELERLTLVTHDKKIARYELPFIWSA